MGTSLTERLICSVIVLFLSIFLLLQMLAHSRKEFILNGGMGFQ